MKINPEVLQRIEYIILKSTNAIELDRATQALQSYLKSCELLRQTGSIYFSKQISTKKGEK